MTKIAAAAASIRIDVETWQAGMGALMLRVGAFFGRVELRRTAGDVVDGLVSDLPRKNCWTLAEYAGHWSADRVQHLLARAVWDHDGVRAEVRAYVAQNLTEGVGADQTVLIVDETGDQKKGSRTAGVQRQYTGTCGRIENCQVAVMMSLATPAGHGFIDTALYLPVSWTSDPDRCDEAGIPAGTEFRTKPELAADMIGDALQAGVDAGWVAADEVYGDNPGFRRRLEARGLSFVLAVSCDHRIVPASGRKTCADAAAAALPRHAWQTLSAGAGAKGERLYDWALIALAAAENGPHQWLLIRRNRRDHTDLAYYRCNSPRHVKLRKLVAVAGTRWRVEQDIQAGKTLAGLDEHQVRTWKSWHRWATLSILAAAFLAVTAAGERARPQDEATTGHHTARDQNNEENPAGLILLTRNEIQRLRAHRTRRIHDEHHYARWSIFRRKHQYRAKVCHHRKRQELQDHELRL